MPLPSEPEPRFEDVDFELRDDELFFDAADFVFEPELVALDAGFADLLRDADADLAPTREDDFDELPAGDPDLAPDDLLREEPDLEELADLAEPDLEEPDEPPPEVFFAADDPLDDEPPDDFAEADFPDDPALVPDCLDVPDFDDPDFDDPDDFEVPDFELEDFFVVGIIISSVC